MFFFLALFIFSLLSFFSSFLSGIGAHDDQSVVFHVTRK